MAKRAKERSVKQQTEVEDSSPAQQQACIAAVLPEQDPAPLAAEPSKAETTYLQQQRVTPPPIPQKAGRLLALEALDWMLAKEDNIRKLSDSLQQAFDVSPVMFFEAFVMKLIPRQTTIQAAASTQGGKAGLSIIISEAGAQPDEAAYDSEQSQTDLYGGDR